MQTASPLAPTLFIDADACPVTREALDAARRHGIHTVVAVRRTCSAASAATTPETPCPRAGAFGLKRST